MSLFDSLFGGLFEEEKVPETIEHPCSNCPGNCALAPDACSVCQPYKEKMIDAIYRVEHRDEIVSQYEVVGTSAQTGTVVCPHCGGHSENHYICDYCGSSLQEGSGKIQVASAADIPNPILEAQDLIFERQTAVREYTQSLSSEESGGFLSSLFGSLFGMDTTEEAVSVGQKMTESEIKEMADYFKVSVSEYLSGLDNGKYPTLSNKKSYVEAQDAYAGSGQDASSAGMLSGLAGLAGALGLGSAILGGTQSVHSGSYHSPSMLGGSSMNLFGLGNMGSGNKPGSIYGQQGHPVSSHPTQGHPSQHPQNMQHNPRPQSVQNMQTAQKPQNLQHSAHPQNQQMSFSQNAPLHPSLQQRPDMNAVHEAKKPTAQHSTMTAKPKEAAKPAKPAIGKEASSMAQNMAQAMKGSQAAKKPEGGKLSGKGKAGGNR